MNCEYCGSAARGSERFCLCCGTRLEEALPAPEPVRQTEEALPLPEGADDLDYVEHPEGEISYIPYGGHPLPLPKNDTPTLQLPTRRSLVKMIFLGLLTLGIYPVVIYSRMVTELNITASRSDGRRTMPFFAMVTLAPLTLLVFPFVWCHKFCGRIGRELQRRGVDYEFGARYFWLWNVLGSLILVGPFIFTHKLTKSMNLINADFNING